MEGSLIRDHEDRARARAEAQGRIDVATQALTRGIIGETDWQRRVSDALSDAYLRWDDPRWQSGFDGDAVLWREARSLILDAIPCDGTLLDIGCANGHLMESLARWGRERGRSLSVYGLELDPKLAGRARNRLPMWATHVFIGNVSNWNPPQPFTYVRTGLEYVPHGRESALIRRLLDEFVEPNGRVLVGPVDEASLDATRDAFVAAGVSDPGVVSASDHNGKVRHVLWQEPSTFRGP